MSKNTTSPRDINSRQRMAQALQLRIAGASLDQVASACGYKNRSGAHHAIRRAMAELPVEHAKEWREIELLRLERLYFQHSQAAGKDVSRAYLCLKIIEQQSKLLGLIVEPQKAEPQKAIVRIIPTNYFGPEVNEQLCVEAAKQDGS